MERTKHSWELYGSRSVPSVDELHRMNETCISILHALRLSDSTLKTGSFSGPSVSLGLQVGFAARLATVCLIELLSSLRVVQLPSFGDSLPL